MLVVRGVPSHRLPALLSSAFGRRKRDAGLNAPAPQVGGTEAMFGVPHAVIPSLQAQSPGLPAGTLPYWDWNGMHGLVADAPAQLLVEAMSDGDSYRGTGSGAMWKAFLPLPLPSEMPPRDGGPLGHRHVELWHVRLTRKTLPSC